MTRCAVKPEFRGQPFPNLGSQAQLRYTQLPFAWMLDDGSALAGPPRWVPRGRFDVPRYYSLHTEASKH
ncbi:hypothetical protein HYQ44_018590 [Verticillium longisporum]|nr:hypothetical protein HYQ44_018590 [Verticillium longisporum]